MRTRKYLAVVVCGALAGILWVARAQETPSGEGGGAMPENPLGLESITQWVLYPTDIEATRTFYVEKLGFSVAYPFGGGPVKGYQLRCGGIGLTLLRIEGHPVTRVENMMLHLRVVDLDRAYREIQEREIPVAMPLQATDWGTRWFHISAPDGLVLAFEQPVRDGAAEPVR
ncbi:MAG: VOC family protein [Planctomycetes bacterium]|nr:VOC family protein [Planctomycetota bacterium]